MKGFNHDIFLIDFNKKQFSEKKSLRIVCEEIGMSRATGSRIKAKQNLTLEAFIKVVNWMKTDANRYLKN